MSVERIIAAGDTLAEGFLAAEREMRRVRMAQLGRGMALLGSGLHPAIVAALDEWRQAVKEELDEA